jgi:hypothetical protein
VTAIATDAAATRGGRGITAMAALDTNGPGVNAVAGTATGDPGVVVVAAVVIVLEDTADGEAAEGDRQSGLVVAPSNLILAFPYHSLRPFSAFPNFRKTYTFLEIFIKP